MSKEDEGWEAIEEPQHEIEIDVTKLAEEEEEASDEEIKQTGPAWQLTETTEEPKPQEPSKRTYDPKTRIQKKLQQNDFPEMGDLKTETEKSKDEQLKAKEKTKVEIPKSGNVFMQLREEEPQEESKSKQTEPKQKKKKKKAQKLDLNLKVTTTQAQQEKGLFEEEKKTYLPPQARERAPPRGEPRPGGIFRNTQKVNPDIEKPRAAFVRKEVKSEKPVDPTVAKGPPRRFINSKKQANSQEKKPTTDVWGEDVGPKQPNEWQSGKSLF